MGGVLGGGVVGVVGVAVVVHKPSGYRLHFIKGNTRAIGLQVGE